MEKEIDINVWFNSCFVYDAPDQPPSGVVCGHCKTGLGFGGYLPLRILEEWKQEHYKHSKNDYEANEVISVLTYNIVGDEFQHKLWGLSEINRSIYQRDWSSDDFTPNHINCMVRAIDYLDKARTVLLEANRLRLGHYDLPKNFVLQDTALFTRQQLEYLKENNYINENAFEHLLREKL